MDNKWDLRWLGLAEHISSWSKDPSTKVGSVIANGKKFVSMGYNGFPEDMPDQDQLYQNREEKYSRIIHGEMNAVLFAEQSVRGCTLYTYPFMSCDRCMVHMLQAGIRRFVAPKPTEDQIKRWGDSFLKTRKYAAEVGAEIIEIDFNR